jgi:hypothetical protein
MSDTVETFDLGSVGGAQAVRPARAPFRTPIHPRQWDWAPSSSSELCSSLSLILPGAGQALRREPILGAFFLTTMLFLWTFAWAVLDTFDRVIATLALLDISVAVPLWTLAAAYVTAGGLHVACVWNASLSIDTAEPLRAHPALPAAASAVVPGWGQLLNGDRLRGVLFLGALWIVAGVWIAGSSSAVEFFNTFVSTVSPLEQSLRSPFVAWTARWTLPTVIWCLAVYDAAASAANRR